MTHISATGQLLSVGDTVEMINGAQETIEGFVHLFGSDRIIFDVLAGLHAPCNCVVKVEPKPA